MRLGKPAKICFTKQSYWYSTIHVQLNIGTVESRAANWPAILGCQQLKMVFNEGRLEFDRYSTDICFKQLRSLDGNAVRNALGQQIRVWDLKICIPLFYLGGDLLQLLLKARNGRFGRRVDKQVFTIVANESLWRKRMFFLAFRLWKQHL